MKPRSFTGPLAGLVALLLLSALQAPPMPIEPEAQPESAPSPAAVALPLHELIEVDRASSLSAVDRSEREISEELEPEEVEPAESEPEPAEPVESDASQPDCSELTCIALTFDDGPVPGTDRLLDILAERDVPATFFLIGSQIKGHQQIVERMSEEGHAVGNHSWSHQALPALGSKSLKSEIARGTDALRAAGVTDPSLFRPPYGDVSDGVMKTLGAHGYAGVLWNVDPEDWRVKDSEAVASAVTEAAQPGAIVLLHDIHHSTIDAVPTIIKKLHKQGYTFVTVPDLFDEALEPGEIYRHRPL